MIVVKLMGGLGNQMFQYAAGRALALRHGTELKLDLSFLKAGDPSTTERKYMLDCMNITVQLADPDEVLGLENRHNNGLLSSITRRLFCKNTQKDSYSVLYNFDNK